MSHPARPTETPARSSRRGLVRLIAGVALIAAVLLGTVQPAAASVSQTALSTARVTGTVYAVATIGERTIIGGEFTAVGGLPRTNLAAILPDGTVDPTFAPVANGIVNGLAASADGSRVFIGGDFTSISGVARTDLAAVDAATGAVVEGWQADTNGIVHSVVVKDARVYVGGTFTEIDGVLRRRLAAVDVATSDVNLTFNPWPNWTVKAVTVSPDGTKVYAAGGFTSIGGQSRNGAAEVLSTSGKATAFNPTAGGVALAVALTPDGSRFYFATTNNRLYAYDPAVSNAPVYVIQTGGDTQAIAASATEVYFGGHFTNISTYKTKRNLLASIRVADGSLTSWDPNLNGYMGPWAITTTPTKLVVGGSITRVGAKAQPGLAFFAGTP